MKKDKLYSYWFLLPVGLIYGLIFLLPTILSFFFSTTVWTLDSFKFVGLENYVTFFTESYLNTGIKNTIVFALVSCTAKVIIGYLLAVFIDSRTRARNLMLSVVYFPHLISALAIGLAFTSLFNPTKGPINMVIELLGFTGPNWFNEPALALGTVIFTDVWTGVGIATIIYLAGIRAIPRCYYEAAFLDGASKWDQFWKITVPLSRPSMNTVIILAFIGGMRVFDILWVMTKGGPGYSTDVLASIVYKQYAAGYYGLATTGNVVMLLIISIMAFPLYKFLLSRERDS